LDDDLSNEKIRTAASSHPTATFLPSGGQIDADVIPILGSAHGANPAPASASDDEQIDPNRIEGENGSAT
jgi:hypothetical protein